MIPVEKSKIFSLEKKLIKYDGIDRIVSFEEMGKIMENRGTPDVELKTLIPTLDKTVGGFVGGELIVVSGITGEGKSLICQTFTNNFTKQDVGSLWFTYEMPPQYFIRRFKNNMPIAYLPQELTSNKTDWVEERILEAKLKYNVKAVWPDGKEVSKKVFVTPALQQIISYKWKFSRNSNGHSGNNKTDIDFDAPLSPTEVTFSKPE